MHEHSVRRLSLSAMAGDGVAVIKVWMRVDSHRDGAARLQPQMKPTEDVDLLEVASPASVGDLMGAVRSGDGRGPRPQTGAIHFAVERDPLQSSGVVGHPLTRLARHGQAILVGIHVMSRARTPQR